jgi:hypothetical protein
MSTCVFANERRRCARLRSSYARQDRKGWTKRLGRRLAGPPHLVLAHRHRIDPLELVIRRKRLVRRERDVVILRGPAKKPPPTLADDRAAVAEGLDQWGAAK